MQIHTTPVYQQERAQILDILRGIAILGILLNNIYGFSGYGFLSEEMKQQFSSNSADNILNFLQITFVEGKFYSLFSLLFGIGFSIILIRGEQKGTNALKIFYRRLLVLLFIGAAHLYFVWEGDILFLYAFLGLFLPLFRKCADRTLLILAALFILSPIVIDVIKLLAQATPAYFIESIGRPIDERNGITDDNWRNFLFVQKNAWNNWRSWQESAWAHRFHYLLDSNRLPKVLGMFLLGFYAGRKMIYNKLESNKPLFKKLMVWGFIIGIPFGIAMAYYEGDGKYIYKSAWGLADTISYAFAVVPLSLAYASAICLLWLKTKGVSKLNLFAPVGRMALTNYIMQTVIAITVFYGAGFALGQQFGLMYLFTIAILIYLLQLLFSNVWFRYFQYGPLEWIWRQLTYGKRLQIRKSHNIKTY